MTVGKQAGVNAMERPIWYARKRETDITEDSLRLTGAGRQPSRYHTDVRAVLLNVSYESFELHQSYTIVSSFPSLSLLLFFSLSPSRTRGRKLKEDVERRTCSRISPLLFVFLRFVSFLASYVVYRESLPPFSRGKTQYSQRPTPSSFGNFFKVRFFFYG